MKRQREQAAVEREAKVYFPGLHGLRFFAALAVVIGHVELMKKYNGFANAAENPAIYELGRISVTFFFVLSGFLITYLLLREKRDNGSIAIGRFYVRRILRIWPMYYLTVLVAFVVIPRVHALDIPSMSSAVAGDRSAILGLFLLFLPQVALSLYAPFPYAEPLWSIGVEEQFYLLWPLVVSRVRNVLWIAVPIVVAGIAVKEGALVYASSLHASARELRFWNHFIDYFYFDRFECMAVGAIGAWLVFERREAVLRVLFSVPVQLLVYALSAYALLTPRGKPLLHYTAHSILFCIVIVNVAANPRSLLKLERKGMVFLGNISYAMYLLHEPAIGIVMRWTGTRFESVAENVVLYAASIALTIGLSALAYRFYELPFLRLKSRYAVVQSGPD